ncbi:MAG: response regulator transcription factor [Cyclobacteriaceae bacterium]|nr:response regulator transcription factor [Cyclobacteriaceae bacterium]
MKFRCLIIEDEPLARKLIASHINRVENLEIAGECIDAFAAGNFLRKQRVDLIFLDLQMPEVSGFQFLRTLQNPPRVIVTTAFREFAPEAFDLEVVDYLLKPISFERFTKAINKFFDAKSTTAMADKHPLDFEKYIYVKSDRKLHKTALADIYFIESLDEYVRVHLNGSVLVTRASISSLENALTDERFVRIHRSFIVNANHVTMVSAEGIQIGKKLLPFGRAFKKSAMAALKLKDHQV